MAAGSCGPFFEARREVRRAPQDDEKKFLLPAKFNIDIIPIGIYREQVLSSEGRF
jgi:hypothetical protein